MKSNGSVLDNHEKHDGNDWSDPSGSAFQRVPADMHLCSTNGPPYDILTHKFMLSLHSPVLADMIAKSKEVHLGDGLLTLMLPEDGSLLRDLLRFCYGATMSIQKQVSANANLEFISKIVHVAHKYAMPQVLDVVASILNQAHELNCLRVYFVASGLGPGREEVMRRAARRAVDVYSSLKDQYVPEMEYCDARTYYSLLKFHETCAAVKSTIREHYRVHHLLPSTAPGQSKWAPALEGRPVTDPNVDPQIATALARSILEMCTVGSKTRGAQLQSLGRTITLKTASEETIYLKPSSAEEKESALIEQMGAVQQAALREVRVSAFVE